MANTTITRDELKAALEYEPDTGVFRWKRPHRHLSIGDVAGGVNSQGYVHIKINGRKYKAHRLAWLYTLGRWPRGDLDHINRQRDDNRIANLREVGRSENCRNGSLRKTNTSGTTGVCKHSSMDGWNAKITVNYKTIHLGYFTRKRDAVKARRAAERAHGFSPEHGRTRRKED